MRKDIPEAVYGAPDRLLRRQLKKVPGLVRLKRLVSSKFNDISTLIDERRHRHEIDTIMQFPLFAPNSTGSFKDRMDLTVAAANQTFPSIVQLIESTTGVLFADPQPIETFSNSDKAHSTAKKLESLFKKYGSDKSTFHNYHHLYGVILSDPKSIVSLLEIGLGTNNVDVVSNMGISGKPGASLRAFREFLPDAQIYGADVDRRILFEEDHIKTFFVDQTKPESFDALARAVDSKLDVIIDDGLHSPNANIASLVFACSNLRRGGWFVVEDISVVALPVWRVISALLPSDYLSWIVAAEGGILFVLRKRG
jgi:hypothetical protein